MHRLLWALISALILWNGQGHAQVIEFESNGLKYLTLTKSGVTVMFSVMPQHLKDFAIIQVAISNGSKAPYVIRPEDFTYQRPDGTVLHSASAVAVVQMLEQHGSGSDVIKLITSYENSVYGNQHFKSTNGYEQRRQSVLGMGQAKLKAAAAASALAMVSTRLMPGETTDGAIFFPSEGKFLGPGHLVVRTNTDLFNFVTD